MLRKVFERIWRPNIVAWSVATHDVGLLVTTLFRPWPKVALLLPSYLWPKYYSMGDGHIWCGIVGATLFRLWPKYNGIIVAILFVLTNLISNDSQLIREACFTCILVILIFDNYIIFEVFKLQARLTLP
jgi:hypothetical protein